MFLYLARTSIKDFKVFYQCLFLIVLIFSHPASAQILPPKPKGMNHFVVPEAKEKSQAEQVTTPSIKEPDLKSPYKPLNPFSTSELKELDEKETLIPLKDLEGWKHINDLRSGVKTRIDEALTALELDLGAVPPAGLFYASERYVEKREMEKASILYYLAQLRARFDFKRFPVKGNGITKPQSDMTALSLTVGEKISPWVLSNTARTTHIFNLVEQIDLATPYKYLPTFSLPSQIPAEDTWPDLLQATRKTYFEKTHALRKALSTIKQ